MAHYIDIPAHDGTDSFKGYLALPASGRGPGIVVGQEIFGVNANMRAIADNYAQEGYVAVVPDLFWRMQPGVDLDYTDEGLTQAFDYFGRFDIDRAVDDVDATMAVLRKMEQVRSPAIGFVGFCIGGKLAYLTATRTDVACAVGYYGMGIENHLDEAAGIQGKLVLHFGADDVYCDAVARARIIPALEHMAGAEIYVYDGADHAFARIGGMHFDAAAATLAYARTSAAFQAALAA